MQKTLESILKSLPIDPGARQALAAYIADTPDVAAEADRFLGRTAVPEPTPKPPPEE